MTAGSGAVTGRGEDGESVNLRFIKCPMFWLWLTAVLCGL